jgi:hypothetical protein
MYCANCGKEIGGSTLRCPGCRHLSMASWLTLFNVVAWVAIVPMTYAVFSRLVPALECILAGLQSDISLAWRLVLESSNIISVFWLPMFVVLAGPVLGLAIATSQFPKLGRALVLIGCLGLISMTTLVFADCHYLLSVARTLGERIGPINDKATELNALDSTHRVIVAEFRYRELHPKTGFTCDLESLESLGGPAISGHPNQKANESHLVISDYYLLSLGTCNGQPVTKYEVAAVPRFGGYDRVLSAYCSDGSGAVYSSADGKGETCLTARAPLR